MSEPFVLAIDAVRPSQLLVDADRLATVLGWFDADEPNDDPLPVLPLPVGEGWYLTDGHTRAFVVWLSGPDELHVVRDPDEADLPVPVYERCLAWCEEAGVVEVADFVERVVSRDRFLEDWVRRCHALPEHPGDPDDVDGYT